MQLFLLLPLIGHKISNQSFILFAQNNSHISLEKILLKYFANESIKLLYKPCEILKASLILPESQDC